ncbi:MAG: IS66 family transposase [Bacteroidales bacterium]|nr:IS66 family transposase [Bacteroidales bacterium]
MGRDFNTGLGKSLEADRVKLTRRRKRLLRDMGLSEELDSTELAERLHAQVKVIRGLSRTIEEKDGEIARMDFILSVRDKEIAAKDAKIVELEAKLSAIGHGKVPIPKTSANSSIPPSKNPIGVPHTQSLRKPSGRKTGGQKGHQGSTRLQAENVTGAERWYPAAICPECGKPLDMDTATVCAKRQVVDIPLPIAAEVFDHLQMQVKCSCGHCCKGRFPENVNAPVSYGPNIMAMTSYLSTYQNVPFKRLTHLYETIFGLHISEGSVSNMLNAMRKLSKTPYEMIRQKVAAGKVAGADESGVNVSGRNNWLWAFQNAVATFLAFDKSRSHEVVNKHFSKEELSGMVWVTDRLPAYFMGDVGMEDHQVCIAHLLRNLTYTMRAFPDDAWSLDLLDLLRDSVHQRNQGNMGVEVRTKMEERLDELLARPPVYKNDDGKETELDKLKKGIAKHRDHIFTFLVNPDVPPTNNDSEKALRPAKTKLKVSGCFRSETGVENYATVASVIQTAVKNGQNPFEVLRVIATLALT